MAVTEYTWDPVTDSVLKETDGAGNVLAWYTNEPSTYGPLVSQHRDGKSRFFHFDALGSTRELTDEDENVTDTFAYDAWGNKVEGSGVTEAPFQWVGQSGYIATQSLSGKYLAASKCFTSSERWLIGLEYS